MKKGEQKQLGKFRRIFEINTNLAEILETLIEENWLNI